MPHPTLRRCAQADQSREPPKRAGLRADETLGAAKDRARPGMRGPPAPVSLQGNSQLQLQRAHAYCGGAFNSITSAFVGFVPVFLVSCVTGPLHITSPGWLVRSLLVPSPMVCIALPPVM